MNLKKKDSDRNNAVEYKRSFAGSEFMQGNAARTQVDCIEDAKTAKFALYFIYGLLSEKKGVSAMFPFPLDEFHDDDMNTVFQLIVDKLGEKEGEKEL